jgi:ribose transport system substrate-binding protein
MTPPPCRGLWTLVSALALSAGFTGAAAPQNQADLITPIDKELTFVFIPKVIHPWYDVVAYGGQYAVEELAKEGIKVNMIWDQPPQADVADQSNRIESNIGRQPDGLAVACLDQATNVHLLREAKEAGVNVMTFNSFCSDEFPFVGQKNSYQHGGEGKVRILAGSLTATDHVERINDFKDAMKDFPGVEVVFTTMTSSRRW